MTSEYDPKAGNNPETADSTSRQPEPAKSPATTWAIVIVASLCIAFSAYFITQRTKEKRGADGLTVAERTQRDLDLQYEREQKILASFDPTKRRDLLYDGVEHPEFVPADKAKLGDGIRVIGIGQGENARAFPLNHMSFTNSHLIHDELDGKPLTISYCDRSDNVRVFHRDVEISKFKVAGYQNNRMILQIDGQRYGQTDDDIPLDEFSEYIVCTWSEWKKKHPETKVFVRSD